MQTFSRYLLTIAFSIFALTTQAQSTCCQGDPEQRLAHMAERLNLSEEQKTAVRPMLESSFKKRSAVLEAHGIEPGQGKPNRSAMKGMKGEMRTIREETDAELATVLDESQMAELKQMRAEMQEQMKQQQPQPQNQGAN